MSTPLTPEQRKRIEENKRLALERRAARLAENLGPATKKTFSGSQTSGFYNKRPKQHSDGNASKPGHITSSSFKNVQKSGASTSTSNFSKSLSDNCKKTAAVSQPRQWNIISDALLGTVSLISKDRFILEIGFNEKLVDLCKSIPGRQYDAAKRAWTFPLKEYDKFKEVTTLLSPQIVIGNLPPNVLKMFLKQPEASVDYTTINISCIEPSLVSRLFPFQKEGVQYGVSKGGRCLIADDMGLGKTIQALGIADYYKEDWPMLIVCPSSVRYQWEEEIRRNLPSVPTYSIFVLNSSKDIFDRAQVVILSYDLMCTKKDLLKSYGFGIIIVDECHSLKNIKTKRTISALDLISKSKRVILLSGTPALSRPAELFSQIKALQSSLFRTMIEFGIRYCEGKQDKFGWNFNGSSHLNELKVILEEKIMIRRLKADVLNQLPSKIRKVIIIEAAKEVKKMRAFAKKLESDKMQGTERRSTLLAYFAETGVAKIKAICNHVEQLVEQEKKFLIFAHHKSVLNAICDTLEKKAIYYIRIDGSVNSEERKNVSDQFQAETQYKVAVLSLKAANTGITLTAANLVVFAELFWNPGELIQAEDRAHRIGQESNVLIEYLIAKGTADDYLWPLIQTKLNVLNKAGLTNSTCLDIAEKVDQTSDEQQQQSVITDFFKEIDDDIDDEAFLNVLHEVEGFHMKNM